MRVIMGRLGAAITNVYNNMIDAAIVSSDAFDKWKAANGEICGRRIEIAADLGLAGCCPMLMVQQNRKRREWRKTLDESVIVTSDRTALENFLTEKMAMKGARPDIMELEGGTEALAALIPERMDRVPMIFDLVATGKSAFENGFCPVMKDKESRVILICRAGRKSEELAELCNRFKNRTGKIREAATALYIEMLEKAKTNGRGNESARAFASRRIKEVIKEYYAYKC